MYRQNLYNCEISFNANKLNLIFTDKDSAVEGLSFVVNEKLFTIHLKNIERTYNTSQMKDNNLGVILYNFFSINAQHFVLSKGEDCFYIKHSTENAFVTLKEYTSETGKKTYLIEIT